MRILLVGQLAILIALAVWIVRWPPRSTMGLLLQAGGSLLAVFALARAGLWLFPPWWTPYAAAATIVLATVAHTRHATTRWPAGTFGWGSLIVFTALGGYAATLLVTIRHASQSPAEPQAIALASPLAPGRYLVVNGGGALLINAHRASMDTSITRLRDWRGNGHAVDLVALDGAGLHADGLLPSDPARYRIFGVEVLSPCDGTVLLSVDGLADQSPPVWDRAHPAGNHVMIDCGDAHVLLAHLRQGSVRMGVGDRVRTGAVLGEVGNSGGTDEPHLHIHAQRPGPPGAPMAGDPLPMLLWDRYLVRGDRVVVQ